MFDLDAGKMMVFGIVALAVIPPKDLPRVLRTVGKYVGQMRRMAGDFQGQFAQAMKEADLDSVRKEIDDINKSAKIDTSFDPAALMRDSVTKSVEDAPKEIPPQEALQAEASAPEPAAPPLGQVQIEAHPSEAELADVHPPKVHAPEASAVGPT